MPIFSRQTERRKRGGERGKKREDYSPRSTESGIIHVPSRFEIRRK